MEKLYFDFNHGLNGFEISMDNPIFNISFLFRGSLTIYVLDRDYEKIKPQYIEFLKRSLLTRGGPEFFDINVSIKAFDKEEELYKQFFKMLNILDPELVIGYNLGYFFQYILGRFGGSFEELDKIITNGESDIKFNFSINATDPDNNNAPLPPHKWKLMVNSPTSYEFMDMMEAYGDANPDIDFNPILGIVSSLLLGYNNECEITEAPNLVGGQKHLAMLDKTLPNHIKYVSVLFSDVFLLEAIERNNGFCELYKRKLDSYKQEWYADAVVSYIECKNCGHHVLIENNPTFSFENHYNEAMLPGGVMDNVLVGTTYKFKCDKCGQNNNIRSNSNNIIKTKEV
jgi:DNA-directed RNA polymerase subunit RPC12/RpoP